MTHTKADIPKLQKEYEKLMKEAHKLSHRDRAASDKKYYEADMIGRKIDELNKNG